MKKTKPLILKIICIFSFLLFIPKAVLGVSNESNDSFQRLFLEKTLEERLNPIAKNFDANALVFVKANSTNISPGILPGTPLLLKQLTVKNLNGEIKLSKLEIKIVSEIKEWPSSLTQTLIEAASGFGVTPMLQMKSYNEFISSSKQQEQPLSKTTQILRWFKSNIYYILSSLIFIFLFTFGLSLKKSFLLATKITESGFEKIEKALSEGGFNTSTPTQNSTNIHQGISTHLNSQTANADKDSIREMSSQSILSLLCDTYWSNKNNYGLFIWKNIPHKTKSEIILLPEFKIIADWIDYIIDSDLQEENLNHHQDHYYLSPLPIQALNNNALADLVLKNHVLYFALPKIRVNELPLSALKRLEIEQQKTSLLDQIKSTHWDALLSKIPPSPLNHLKNKKIISIHSIAEEEEVLKHIQNDKKFNLEKVEKIPSLAWILHLSQENQVSLLQEFNANELAAAWIGPPSILEKISTHLPEKKNKLLQAYLKKTKPNRNSIEFKALFEKTIHLLKNNPSSQAETSVLPKLKKVV